MPNDSDGNRQDRPEASPDDRNRQDRPASPASLTRDSSGPLSSSAAPSTNDGATEDKDAIIESLRKEAAKARVDAKRLAEFEKREQERADAELTDKERAEKERATYQQKINDLELARQQAAIRADVKLAARELGISEKLARAILPFADIEFDDEGDPRNVEKLLRAAVVEHEIPLKASGDVPPAAASVVTAPRVTSGGAVNPGRAVSNANGMFDGEPAAVMARISRMTPQEYATYGDQIRTFLAQNWNRLRR